MLYVMYVCMYVRSTSARTADAETRRCQYSECRVPPGDGRGKMGDQENGCVVTAVFFPFLFLSLAPCWLVTMMYFVYTPSVWGMGYV